MMRVNTHFPCILFSLFLLFSGRIKKVLGDPEEEKNDCLLNNHMTIAGSGLRPFFDNRRSADKLPSGVDMDIMRILARKLNMTLSFILSSTWGVERNGVWTGTVGEVFNGSADLGLGHISLDYRRLRIIDYTPPHYDNNVYLVTSRPRPQPQHFNILKPFTTASWIAITLTLITTMILRYLMFQYVLEKAKFGNKGLQNSLYLLASCLDQAVPDLRPNRRCSSLIMTTAWLFFITLIIMAYECNFRAYLVSVDYEPPINNAYDVIKYDRALYVDRGATALSVFRESPLAVFRELHDTIVANDQFFRSFAGIPLSMELRMRDEGAVILLTKLMFHAKAWDMKLRFGSQFLRKGDQPIMEGYSGFVVRKESCLKSLLDSKLLSMMQNGIIAKVMRDNSPNLVLNENTNDSDEEVLTIDHILLANIFFSAGIIASITVFLVEKRQGMTAAKKPPRPKSRPKPLPNKEI